MSLAKALQVQAVSARIPSSTASHAKIDNLEAVHQFEGILKYADGVVVLRNEL